MRRAGRVETWVAAGLPPLLAAGVFAVAFVHIIEIAEWAGQPGWAALILASTGEVMAIAALLEIRHRRRCGQRAAWPVLVLVCAVVFSGAANLAAALVERGPDGRLTGEPGAWRPFMAVWVVVAFGLVAGMKATRGASSGTAPAAADEPAPADDPAPADEAPVAVVQENEPAPAPDVPDDAPEPAPAAAPPVPVDPVALRVAELLPAALDVAREIGNGAPPSGRALVKALRERNHKVPNKIVTPLAEAVAQQWAAVTA